MYNFAGSNAILDDLSNSYTLSAVTVLLAVIISLYFFKGGGRRKKVEVCFEDRAEGWKQDEIYSGKSAQDELHDEPVTQPQRHEKTQHSSAEEDTDEEEVLADGLVGKLKTARVKELEAQLTRDQLQEERRIEREQLAAIFELLKKQEAELNMQEIDERELAAQLNLYR